MTIWYGCVLTVAVLILSSTTWFALRQIVWADLTNGLTNASAGLATYLRIEDTDQSVTLPIEIDEYSRSLQQKHILVVLDSRRKVVFTNTSAQVTGTIASSPPASVLFSVVVQNERYLSLWNSVDLRSGRYATLLAFPEQPTISVINRFGAILAAIVPLFILAGVLGGYWLSRRALLPIAQITEKARSISLANLSERLLVPATRDELEELGQTWNAMLERIETAVTRVTQFTADASHELRTPLAIIRLAAENALRKSRSEDEYRAALRRVCNECESLTSLVEDLLLLARADSNVPAILEPVELRILVESVFSRFLPIAELKNIRLERSVLPEAVFVPANAEAVTRVLRILVENALKYSPKNSSVSIGLLRQDGAVILQVADTGIGIPKEMHLKIFERFFRVDVSRTKESGGYGLGLAIADTLVRQYGGAIQVQANGEQGSVFSVTFPAFDDDAI